MAYTKQDWKNGESGGTPLSADRLNHIETGIADKAQKGDKGAKGDQGERGPAGADGAPSQEDWDDLVARVEALEAE